MCTDKTTTQISPFDVALQTKQSHSEITSTEINKSNAITTTTIKTTTSSSDSTKRQPSKPSNIITNTSSSALPVTTASTTSLHTNVGKAKDKPKDKDKSDENKADSLTNNNSATKGYKLENSTDDDDLTTLHPIPYSLLTTESTFETNEDLFDPINDTAPMVDQLIRPLIIMSVEDHLLSTDSILDPLLYNNDVNNLSAPSLSHYGTFIENVTIYCASKSDCTKQEACVQGRCLRVCDAFIVTECFKGIITKPISHTFSTHSPFYHCAHTVNMEPFWQIYFNFDHLLIINIILSKTVILNPKELMVMNSNNNFNGKRTDFN